MSQNNSIKQQEIIRQLNEAIEKAGIKIEYNPTDTGRFESKIVSLDVEHDESGGFVGTGVYSGSGPVCYFSSVASLLRVPFHSLDIIAHNGVSDFECLRMWGVKLDDKQLVFDTMLVGHILDSSLKSYSLKDMAKRELNIIYPSYDEIVGKRGLKAERITLDKQPMELVAKYNAMDTWSTYQLYLKQRKACGNVSL